MFGHENLNHLKLWVAVVRHNLKWLPMGKNVKYRRWCFKGFDVSSLEWSRNTDCLIPHTAAFDKALA